MKMLDYLQVVARVADSEGKDRATRLWYPDCDARMTYLILSDQAKLIKYVLHAKHAKIDSKPDKCDWLQGEVFEETMEKITDFI